MKEIVNVMKNIIAVAPAMIVQINKMHIMIELISLSCVAVKSGVISIVVALELRVEFIRRSSKANGNCDCCDMEREEFN